MDTSESDRRRHPRSFRKFDGFEDKSNPGVINEVENISCSGVLCYTPKAVPPMTKMELAVLLPDHPNHRIECDGVVVRCNPDKNRRRYRLAIVFTRLSDEDYEILKDSVDKHVSTESSSA